MMEYTIDAQGDDADLRYAVRLHEEALSYRSFIARFGSRFLLRIYEDILERELGFLVFAKTPEERIAGFLLACTDVRKLFSLTMKQYFDYFVLMLPRLITRPHLAARTVETLLYPHKESISVFTELLVIAVERPFRSKEIGMNLVRTMEREFVRRGINEYKVTVHESMADTNRFYRAIGMTRASAFRLYGTTWNLYTKRIERQ
jgi:ribosomal protein S18 acetylase RimI-like enzyme